MRFIDAIRIPIPAKTDHIRRKYLDIPYADGYNRRKLDIYLPNEGEGPFPFIVDIHGGGWYFGDKSEHKLDPALHMLERGYAVVSIAYSLSWKAKLPTQIYEVKAAIRFLKAHAEEYSLDKEHVALWGESSGSHYAALTATSASMGELEDFSLGGHEEETSRVQAVIGWFTPTNLGNIAEQLWVCGQDIPARDNQAADCPPGVVLGDAPGNVPELVKMVDPNTYVNENCPPFFLFHGTNDCVVPILSSMNFAANLIRAIGRDKVQFRWVEGARHIKDDFDNEENYRLIGDFLDRYLKG